MLSATHSEVIFPERECNFIRVVTRINRVRNVAQIVKHSKKRVLGVLQIP